MSKLSLAVLAAAVVAFTTTGCGGSSSGSDSPASSGSCMMPASEYSCFEFNAAYPVAAVQQACTAGGATYSSSACPTANRVGRCAITQQGVGVTIVFYTGSGMNAAGCTQMGGTWTAG